MSETFLGNNIIIDNINNNKSIIKTIIGNHKQETREGYNLLDLSKFEQGGMSTVEESFGSNFENPRRIRSTYIAVKSNTDYTIQLFDSSIIKILYVFEYTEEKIGIKYIDSSTNDLMNFTTSDSTKFIRIAFAKIDNSIINVNELQKAQLIEGKILKPYEAYGVSPSPYYPSEIKTVKDNINFVISNKNMINIPEFTVIGGTKTWNGKVFEEVFPEGKYVISRKFEKSSNAPSSAGLVQIKLDGVIYNNINANKNSLNLNLEKTTKVTLSFFLSTSITSSEESSIRFYDVQFEKSESVSDYVKHKGKKINLPIQQEMFDKEDYINNEEEVHTYRKIILTGNEYFSVYNSSQTGTYETYRFEVSGENNQTVKSWNENNGIYSTHFGFSGYHVSTKDKIGLGTSGNNSVYICSDILTLEEFKAWVKEQYEAGTPVTIWIKMQVATKLPLTIEQKNILTQLQNLKLYEDINHIIAFSSVEPNLEVIVKKIIEDYNFYISSDGYLIIPELNIKYLIDFNESNIPIMPEAVESTVRAAGRNGDIVLNTTYEPISFNIVCYTEDNLTLKEKIKEENKINYFLNSIKNKNISLAFEKYDSFYNVKYNTLLTTINFPQHLKFAIPLKSSNSYGKDLIKKNIVGNATEESNTIEDVGAVFTIYGPANNPIISLNDYSMEYNMSILDGAKIVIDSNKSTVIHENSDGVKTNVMKHYNHQFPKIENGINELKILSGIDNDKNVIVEWFDLKL